MSAMLDAALAYARRGIPIFPCIPNSKKPATARGFHDATTDETVIRSWWQSGPADFNIAFSPQTIGQGVVDLDGQDGIDAWRAFAGDRDYKTYIIRTPRGGFHLYYEGELPTSVRRLIPGKPVDTRGKGSYALLPPSATPDGTYAVFLDRPVSPMPEFLTRRVALMRDQSVKLDGPVEWDTVTNLSRATAYLAGRNPAVEGRGGDEHTYQTACDLCDLGISEERAVTLMEVWNETCVPPWDMEELQGKIANAYRYAQNSAGSKVVEPAASMLAKIEAPIPKRVFAFRSPGQWGHLKRSPSIIDGILPAQGTGLLYAPPGSFKSFIAQQLAFAVATGKPAFGQFKVGRVAPVAYCAGEGHLAVATQRLPALFSQHGVALDDQTPFYLLNGLPLARAVTEGIIGQFMDDLRACLGSEPGLIVLDTVARSMAGLNENDASDAGKFLELAETIARDMNCFVLGVAHEGKDGTRGVRGSSAIEAGVDVIWQARRPNENSPGVSLHCRKDKDGDTHGAIYLIGEKVGDGLVFNARAEQEWAKASGKRPGMVTPADIRHALEDLGAMEGNTVTTTVLAEQLAGGGADAATVKAKQVALGRGTADGTLLGYVVHMSEHKRDPALWSIPAISKD